MSIPKMLTAEQVAEALELTTATLERYRREGIGPNFLKMPSGTIRYLESDVIAYLESCRQLPTEAQKMQQALLEGRAGVRAAQSEKLRAMQALDAADRVPDAEKTIDGVTPLVMGIVGQAPGSNFERHSTVPGMTTFNDRSAVAVAPAVNGRVPVPK